MGKRFRILLSIMSLALVFATCSTDFELNQPTETPVLFGVLDPSADTQWVKLNKSFLGDGNNFEYAAINDCTEYDNVTITVEENGGANRTWILSETYVPVDNSSGIFYTDSQKVYYFVPGSALDPAASYSIKGEFDDNKPTVEATTSLIGTFGFDGLFKAQLFGGLEFENGTGLPSPNYIDNFKVKWNLGEDAKRYDLTIRFHYTEHFNSGGSAEKYIDWFQGSQTTINTDGIGQMERTINTELFYQFIQTHPQLADLTDVQKRVAQNFEFILTAAHDELNTYIEINEPVSGIVTERPTFTNVTNGIGIFSAKAQVILDRASALNPLIRFKKNSMEELCLGQYTTGLLFCSDSAAYSSEAFFCP